MNNTWKKAVAAGLVACLTLGSLAGCSKKEEKFDTAAAAITVNGDEISAGLVKFAVHYNQAMMEGIYKAYMGLEDPMSQDLYGNGSTLGDMVKSDVVASLENMVLAEQKMDEYSVALTDEEKTAIADAAKHFIDDNGEEVLEQMCATQEIVERYLTLRTIQNKLDPELSADVDTEVSDEEAAQRKVQYVLFQAETEGETEAETGEASTESGSEAGQEASTESGSEKAEAETAEPETAGETAEEETASLSEEDTVKTQAAAETENGTESEETAADDTEAGTDAEDATEAEATEEESGSEAETETETETEDPAIAAAMAEAYAQAEEMIELVKSGEEFEAAAAKIDETAACSTLTFGSDSTTINTALIEATEGLDDNTLVETPVKVSTGYYVVQVISKLDREATDEKKEDIVEERKSERVSELYTEWRDAAEITEKDEVLAQIKFTFTLTQQTEAATEAESETGSESGTEETTETSSESGTEGTTEAGSESDTEGTTETGSESGTEAPAETDTEAKTEAPTEAVTDAGTESESEK